MIGWVGLAAVLRAVHARQPDAVPEVASPLRPLQYGQLNILHSTDT